MSKRKNPNSLSWMRLGPFVFSLIFRCMLTFSDKLFAVFFLAANLYSNLNIFLLINSVQIQMI